MGKLEDLLKARDDLDEQIKDEMKQARKDAKKQVRELCKQYEFTSWDLRGALALTAAEAKEQKEKK